MSRTTTFSALQSEMITKFAPEQVNRMRCTIENYCPDLPDSQMCAPASVATRNAGANPNVYTATAAVIGQPTTFTVATGTWSLATIFGSLNPDNRTADFGVVLINIDSNLFFTIGPIAGPNAQVQQIVTSDPSLCGTTIYSQAKLHNAAVRPFVITNAVDLTIGI